MSAAVPSMRGANSICIVLMQAKPPRSSPRRDRRVRPVGPGRTRGIANAEGFVLQVFARDDNVDQALCVLKKRTQREGVFRETKRRRFHEKPSTKAAREKGEAVRRARKAMRKQAIREGLIAAPPNKKIESRVRRPGASDHLVPDLRCRAAADRCISFTRVPGGHDGICDEGG